MKLALKLALTALVLLLIFAGIRFALFLTIPPQEKADPQLFQVQAGASMRQVARALKQQQLVSDAFYFRLLARLTGKAGKLKRGEYELHAALRPIEILVYLTEGKIKRYRLTLPEGQNIEQLAETLAAAGLCEREAFVQTARDTAWVKELGLPGETLEGFLYPETYYFSKGRTAKQLQEAMVKLFRENFAAAMIGRAQKMGFDLLQIVSLASIIEKETGVAAERRRISAVFHNRLKRGMRLQADPTVIYGIPNFDGNLTRKQLETWSPYNTYRIDGLPKGPIANPGLASLQAALDPAKDKALYFVARGDGTHVFANTLVEHNRNVEKYQLRRRRK